MSIYVGVFLFAVIFVWLLTMAGSQRLATLGHMFTLAMLSPFLIQHYEAVGMPARLFAYATADLLAGGVLIILYAGSKQSEHLRRIALMTGAAFLLVSIVCHGVFASGGIQPTIHAIITAISTYIAVLCMGFTAGTGVLRNVIEDSRRYGDLRGRGSLHKADHNGNY